jgi:lipoate---protein ligase
VESGPLFDVERFRAEPQRLLVVRVVTSPTVVLGSTQPSELVVGAAAHTSGVDIARRRGGGGAVYLEPGDPLWLDAWIPHDDPLWQHDVSAAASWVGAWWVAALEELGLRGLDVHTGRAVPGDLGELVCFAGRGPGEVFHHGQKVVGLSQWRAREGALFSSCAYLRWDPDPMLELFDVDEGTRAELSLALASVAAGLATLHPSFDGLEDLGGLAARLRATFPSLTAGGAVRGSGGSGPEPA